MEIHFPAQAGDVPFTGERYVPGISGQIQFEHFHRYLYASEFTAGKAVLDIACGEGYGSQALAPRAAQVVGIDIDLASVQRANQTYRRPNLRYLHGSLEAIPQADQSFDVVACFETLEHVGNQRQALSELARVLKGDGLLLISTPNAGSDDQAWHEGNPFHTHELTRQEFQALLAERFQHVRIVEQRYLIGSVIGGPETSPGACSGFESADGSTFHRVAGGLGDSYFIALASNAPLPAAGFSILDSQAEHRKLTDDFRYAVDRMHQLERDNEALRSQHTQAIADLRAANEFELAALKARLEIALIQLQQTRQRLLAP